MLCICLTSGVFLSGHVSGRVVNHELQHMFKWFSELGSKYIDPSKIIFHESDHMRDSFCCVSFLLLLFCFLVCSYVFWMVERSENINIAQACSIPDLIEYKTVHLKFSTC